MAKRMRAEKIRRAPRRGGGEPEAAPAVPQRTRRLLGETQRLLGQIDQRLATR